MQTSSISHSADSGAGVPFIERSVDSGASVPSIQQSTFSNAHHNIGLNNGENAIIADPNGGHWSHTAENSRAHVHQVQQQQQSLSRHDRLAVGGMLPSDVGVPPTCKREVPPNFMNKNNDYYTRDISTNFLSINAHESSPHLTTNPHELTGITSLQLMDDGAISLECERNNVFPDDDHRPFHCGHANNITVGGNPSINLRHGGTSAAIARHVNNYDQHTSDSAQYVGETPSIPLQRQHLREPSGRISPIYSRPSDEYASEKEWSERIPAAPTLPQQKNADKRMTATAALSCADRENDGERMTTAHSLEQKSVDGKMSAVHSCVDRDDDERAASGEQHSAVAAGQPTSCAQHQADNLIDDYEPLRIWANGMFAAEVKVRAEVDELTSQWKKIQWDVSQQKTRRDFIRERGIRAEKRLGISNVESESLLKTLTEELCALESEVGELREDIGETQRGHVEASSRSLKLYVVRTIIKESLDVMKRDFEQLQRTVEETVARVAQEQQAVAQVQSSHDLAQHTLTRDKDALDDLRKTILILPDDIAHTAISVADKERNTQQLRRIADTWHSLTSDALQAFGAFQDTCRTDVERLEALSAYSPRQDTSDPLVPFAHHLCDIQSDAEGIAQRMKWRSAYMEAMMARYTELNHHKVAQKNCQDMKLEICAKHNKMLERELESIVEEKRRLLAPGRQGEKHQPPFVLVGEPTHRQKKRPEEGQAPSPQCTNCDNCDCDSAARICVKAPCKHSTLCTCIVHATDGHSSSVAAHMGDGTGATAAGQGGKAENNDWRSSSVGTCNRSLPVTDHQLGMATTKPQGYDKVGAENERLNTTQDVSLTHHAPQYHVLCTASRGSSSCISPSVVKSPRTTMGVKEAECDSVDPTGLEMLPANHAAGSTGASSSPRTREVATRALTHKDDPYGPWARTLPNGEPYAGAQTEIQPFRRDGELYPTVAKHATENGANTPELGHNMIPSASSSGCPPHCTPPKLYRGSQANSTRHTTALQYHGVDTTEILEQTRCESARRGGAANTRSSSFREFGEGVRLAEANCLSKEQPREASIIGAKYCHSKGPRREEEQEANFIRHTKKGEAVAFSEIQVPKRKVSLHLGTTIRHSEKVGHPVHRSSQQTTLDVSQLKTTPSSTSSHPCDAPFHLGTTADASMWSALRGDDNAAPVSSSLTSHYVAPSRSDVPRLETLQDEWVATMVMRCDHGEETVGGALGGTQSEEERGDLGAPRHDDVELDDSMSLALYERPRRRRTDNAPSTSEDHAPANVSEFFATNDDIPIGPPRRSHKSRRRAPTGNGNPPIPIHGLHEQQEDVNSDPWCAPAGARPELKHSNRAQRRGKWEGRHSTCENRAHGVAASEEATEVNSVARIGQTRRAVSVLQAGTRNNGDMHADWHAKGEGFHGTTEGGGGVAGTVGKKNRNGIRYMWRVLRRFFGTHNKNWRRGHSTHTCMST
eukprot:GEMP01001706.1.p1 GENE.GEMP01001706.1~~GEMP01001706.1.p1  ORF type:complete len:1452 (+),score=337.90 GEMP01001706.1:66-4421(+)